MTSRKEGRGGSNFVTELHNQRVYVCVCVCDKRKGDSKNLLDVIASQLSRCSTARGILPGCP